MMLQFFRKTTVFLFPCLIFLLGASGCMATRGWVQKQLDPVKGQVSVVENRLDHTEAKMEMVTSRVSEVENNLGQTKEKADLAMRNLENLRLEQRFVLSVKEGANFALNPSDLNAETLSAIDGFLGSLPGTNDAIFLVTGHTDSAGSENYNYELGQKRAAGVAQYLISRRGIDPLRVKVASYGENAPLSDNVSSQGRHKNRRVEILVYKEAITSAPLSPSLELRRDSSIESKGLSVSSRGASD